MRKLGKEIIWIGSLLIIALLVISFVPRPRRMDDMSDMNMDEKREHFISLKEEIIQGQIPMGKYKCCLENPCTYCIEEGECGCLEDVMNGVHPCGECIGEILEGHGNPLIAEYFAKAIAEKTGQEDAIKEIIFEKYGIAVEDQV